MLLVLGAALLLAGFGSRGAAARLARWFAIAVIFPNTLVQIGFLAACRSSRRSSSAIGMFVIFALTGALERCTRSVVSTGLNRGREKHATSKAG